LTNACDGKEQLRWIYGNDIEKVWNQYLERGKAIGQSPGMFRGTNKAAKNKLETFV
jgi:hypothetical protein